MRPAHLQTILASSGPRRLVVARRSAQMVRRSQDLLLDCGDGVRLMARHTRHDGAIRDLVVLLHGWEGSADSQYVLSAAAHLYDEGYDVLRLNLRDHGPTHHLNRELFHSCLIEEVIGALAAVDATLPHRRLLFLGYSLGGNFGLRVALRAPAQGIQLDRVVAICPVLDPRNTMRRLESSTWIYRHYFVQKWVRSLRRKAAAWPDVFDFSVILKDPSLCSITRGLVAAYSGFPSLDAYMQGYAVVGDVLAGLTIPTLLLAALDDPIIPAEDLSRLSRPTALTVEALPNGGHCGFLDALRGPSWADRRVAAWFADPSAGPSGLTA